MKLTKSQKIRLFIARVLFYEICDSHRDEKLKVELWKRIDRELKAARLTRGDL